MWSFQLFSLLLLIWSTLTRSQSCSPPLNKIVITCTEIKSIEYPILGSLQACWSYDEIISTSPDALVTSVVHKNGSEVTDLVLAQIFALYIEQSTVKFIPAGIRGKFANLKALHIRNSDVVSVNKENLREFGDSLESLAIHNELSNLRNLNQLTSLDANLLDYNPNLKAVYFFRNPIRHIQPEFFTKLKTLKNIQYVHLESLTCMNQIFYAPSGHNISTFLWNNGGCANETARVETQLAPISSRMQETLNNDVCLDAKITSATTKLVENLDEATSTSNARFDSIERSITEKSESLEEKINVLTAQIQGAVQMLIEENSALKSSLKMMNQKMLQKIKCRFDTLEQNCFQQT